MATQVRMPKENIEAVADSFIKDLIAKGLIEDVRVQVVGDSRESRAAQAAEVHAYLKTLDTDESIRFDVSSNEVADEIVHAQPVPEPDVVDIDMDADGIEPGDKFVLAKSLGRHRHLYFAGVQLRTKKILWAHDIRLGQPLTESDVVNLCFQFGNTAPTTLIESFAALRLQLVPVPARE